MIRAPHSKRRRAALAALERYVVNRADLVLFTSDYTQAAYCRQYPSVARRSLVLYNGVDEDDFDGAVPSASSFTFTYTGSIHEYQHAQVRLFLEAFAAGSALDPSLASARVHFIGPRPAATEGWLSTLVNDLGIHERVILDTVVRHRKAMEAVRSAGALLLFAGDNRFIHLSKISPYLAAERPILAFAVSDSESGRHVREAGHVVFDGTTVEELVPILRTLAHAGPGQPSGRLQIAHPHPLHWRTAAMRLGRELDRLTAASSVSRNLHARGQSAP
jgi:hypothetical protein